MLKLKLGSNDKWVLGDPVFTKHLIFLRYDIYSIEAYRIIDKPNSSIYEIGCILMGLVALGLIDYVLMYRLHTNGIKNDKLIRNNSKKSMDGDFGSVINSKLLNPTTQESQEEKKEAEMLKL